MTKNNGAHKRSEDYKVGKGRPPHTTRWKPGQSGNPRGRPRGAKNLATLLASALDEKIQIQEKGKVRVITAREGIVKRVTNEALKGNFKAITLLLRRECQVEQMPQDASSQPPFEEPVRDEPFTKGQKDERALAAYLRLVRG